MQLQRSNVRSRPGIKPGTRLLPGYEMGDMKWEVALHVNDLQVPHFTLPSVE
jgi:hypothetical protein